MIGNKIIEQFIFEMRIVSVKFFRNFFFVKLCFFFELDWKV
jgi:hypothetical protein